MHTIPTNLLLVHILQGVFVGCLGALDVCTRVALTWVSKRVVKQSKQQLFYYPCIGTTEKFSIVIFLLGFKYCVNMVAFFIFSSPSHEAVSTAVCVRIALPLHIPFFVGFSSISHFD